MVQAMSLFNQLLQHFPSLEFAALVKKHEAERAAKGFSCRTQLVAMLFCQLAHADSLREICNGLACCVGKLVHLGINVAPKKSTLSYANLHRPAKLYEELFYTALGRFRDDQGLGVRKHKFRFKNKVRPGNLWVELGSSLALSEEAVEFTAGGVEGALLLF
jgi:hypothetical protein